MKQKFKVENVTHAQVELTESSTNSAFDSVTFSTLKIYFIFYKAVLYTVSPITWGCLNFGEADGWFISRTLWSDFVWLTRQNTENWQKIIIFINSAQATGHDFQAVITRA